MMIKLGIIGSGLIKHYGENLFGGLWNIFSLFGDIDGRDIVLVPNEPILNLSILLTGEPSTPYLAEYGSGGILIEGADDDSSVRVLQEVHLGLKVIPGVTEG